MNSLPHVQRTCASTYSGCDVGLHDEIQSGAPPWPGRCHYPSVRQRLRVGVVGLVEPRRPSPARSTVRAHGSRRARRRRGPTHARPSVVERHGASPVVALAGSWATPSTTMPQLGANAGPAAVEPRLRIASDVATRGGGGTGQSTVCSETGRRFARRSGCRHDAAACSTRPSPRVLAARRRVPAEGSLGHAVDGRRRGEVPRRCLSVVGRCRRRASRRSATSPERRVPRSGRTARCQRVSPVPRVCRVEAHAPGGSRPGQRAHLDCGS